MISCTSPSPLPPLPSSTSAGSRGSSAIRLRSTTSRWPCRAAAYSGRSAATALSIGANVFSQSALSPAAQTIFGLSVTAASGVVFILVTAWAFVAARRRSLIGPPTVWSAMGIWGALCTLVVLYWSLHRHPHTAMPLPVYVAVVGLLALVVFPFAAAPLALAWNRTR